MSSNAIAKAKRNHMKSTMTLFGIPLHPIDLVFAAALILGFILGASVLAVVAYRLWRAQQREKHG